MNAMMNNEPSAVAIMTIARDADMAGRRGDAINILMEEGGFALAEAIDVLTPPRLPEAGDILSCSWGYEQTRVDFYEVTKVTTKTITVREIHKRYVSRGERGDGSVVPVPGAFKIDEKPLTGRRFNFPSNMWGNENKWRYSIRIEDYSTAYLWDGEACGESGEH